MLLKKLEQLLESESLTVGDAVEVRAGAGDGYGEAGRILQIRTVDGRKEVHVEFEAGYKRWVRATDVMKAREKVKEARERFGSYTAWLKAALMCDIDPEDAALAKKSNGGDDLNLSHKGKIVAKWYPYKQSGWVDCKVIKEARDPQLSYEFKEVKGRVDRITVRLEAKRSEIFTKLAKRYKDLDNELKKLEVLRDALNAETKEKVLSYFDAEDEVLTRVVETVSMTATMSKQSHPAPKVDHEKVLGELIKLMPELTDKVKELEAAFTTIPKPKSPSLSVKTNEGVSDLWSSFVNATKRLLGSIRSWGKSYDAKLAKIKGMMVTEAAGPANQFFNGYKKISLMEEKADVVELTQYDERNIPHKYWTDGVLYRGVNVYQAVYEKWPGALQQAERRLRRDSEVDMQECYLGYSKARDSFMLGFDGWTSDDDGGDTNCSPYIIFKMDESGNITVTAKGTDMSGQEMMWYGEGGGREAALEKWPDMTEIRLD